jgi:thiol:disulfide interchange protein DsbC
MLRLWECWVVVLATLPVYAASGDEAAGKLQELQSVIQAHDPGAQVVAPERSPVSGLYLTSIDGVSGYVSSDGRYFVVGDMLDLKSRRNVTEEGRKERRRGLLRKIAPGEAIVFGPEKAKYTIIVFTDADCPYCRKLHGELDQLQARGVAVRYLAFPRSGPGTKSWRTMAAVWCAGDRRNALTRATRGDEVSAANSCSDALIAKHYALGQQLGIPGTPMIVLSDGTSLGGYMSPDEVLAALREHAARAGGNSHEP